MSTGRQCLRTLIHPGRLSSNYRGPRVVVVVVLSLHPDNMRAIAMKVSFLSNIDKCERARVFCGICGIRCTQDR